MADYVIRWDLMNGVRVAWPELPADIDAVSITLSDDNSLLSLEGFGETEADGCFDQVFDVATIPECSQRALVALALNFGDIIK